MNLEDIYRLLRTDHIQAQGIIDTVEQPMLVLDRGLFVKAASRAFLATFKVDRYETIGEHLRELGNGQWNIPQLLALLEDVIPNAGAVIDYEIEHDFPSLGRRTMLVTARRLHHPDNVRLAMLVTIVDATARKNRDAEREMLFRELRHRMRNLLSVTQTIARNTSISGRTAEEYREDFLGRFAALAQSELLFLGEEHTGDLRSLVDRILAPYVPADKAIEIETSVDVALDRRALQDLGLVLHELTTNAAKYGALSVEGGVVRINWRVGMDGRDFHLTWHESGGPPVTPPTTQGYGTQLIDGIMKYSCGGHVERTYAPGGLTVDLTMPLRLAAETGS
jgi:two-component sensor histidine kinase